MKKCTIFQTGKIFDIFQITRHLYRKTNKVRNLKRALNVEKHFRDQRSVFKTDQPNVAGVSYVQLDEIYANFP